MSYFAHSPKGDIPAQPYSEHICNVSQRTRAHSDSVCKYATHDADALRLATAQAAAFHDLGKLDEENQQVLSGKLHRDSLPKNHVDAGTAHFLSGEIFSVQAAEIINAHHIGYPDLYNEGKRGHAALRDESIMQEVDLTLNELEAKHSAAVTLNEDLSGSPKPCGDWFVFLRLALSCLADADHEDTAIHYKKQPPSIPPPPALKPKERLRQLNYYIDELKRNGKEDELSLLRTEMYTACRDADISRETYIVSCDSPVGSGKTTAAMAHLLSQAESRELRRIFVILPTTNIIEQSVKVYRRALVLPGEREEDVVAELHHRADFESMQARHLTSLWRAPIIVTTAVAFFETLASNHPSTLRRLHELPGSAVFVDESHAALPLHLMPIAWKWINIYAAEWGCYWLLASGSLNRFWTIKDLIPAPTVDVPEIVQDNLRRKLSAHENKRVTFKADLVPKTAEALVNWTSTFPGPRLIILNTVQSAAVVADHFSATFGRERVEHLSSALMPLDKKRTLERIIERLSDSKDTDWTLVATSCVEAGVDLSFRTGFREAASTISLIQTAGRIDRRCEYLDSEVWTFVLAASPLISTNPTLKASAEVLTKYFKKGTEISAALSTDSVIRELKERCIDGLHNPLLSSEANGRFPDVEERFRIIDDTSEIAIVSREIAEKVRSGVTDWKELQMNSVQIPEKQLKRSHQEEIIPGIYDWVLGYDEFLGYMAGIVPIIKNLHDNSSATSAKAH